MDRRLVHQHYGSGDFGLRVVPHTKGTASPSPNKMTPTSRPLDFSMPSHNCRRTFLQQEGQAKYTKSILTTAACPHICNWRGFEN